MMSIPTTSSSNCSKRHFNNSNNFNLINNNHNNNNNKQPSPHHQTTLLTIKSNNSISCGSNNTNSRIPILIRLPSPGPYRRSPISQRLRNNRRSNSLTNSPIPKTRKACNQTSITTITNPIKYGKQFKYTTTATTTSLKMDDNNSPILIKKDIIKDVINNTTTTNNIVDNNISPTITTISSNKKDSITLTSQIMDNKTIKSSPASTSSSSGILLIDEVDDNKQKINLIENSIKALKLNDICSPSNKIENGDLKNNDGIFTNNMRCYTSKTIMNGPISPIYEEGISNDIITKRDTNGMTLDLNGTSTKPKTDINNIINGTKARTPKSPYTPRTPLTPSGGQGSSNKLTPKTPPVTPDSYNTYFDDDLDSLYSYSSGRSTMSCDHPYVARNGTTFSGRKMKYVVHCSSHAGQVGQDYLTPTQRAQRQLRRLKELLIQARQDLEQKDSELCRLTREVVELRLFKASLSSPEDRSNSSDAVTVREALTDLKTSQDVSPIIDMIDDGIKSSPRHILHNHHQQHGINNTAQFIDKISNSEMASSFADSGHFEDMTSSVSQHSHHHIGNNNINNSIGNCSYDEQRSELIQLYEKKIEELIKNQDLVTSDMKRTHNDRVEALLQKLAECNTRYADIVPDYEQAKERIRELEKQMDDLENKLREHEDKQKKMYLHMYNKEQEDEQIAQADKAIELAHRSPVSVPELLQQLQSTQDELENIRVSNSRDCALLTAKEAISLWVLGARKTIYRCLIDAQQNKTKVDPEVTLQFLKSAIYYFLTDKENSQGHLNAIESILEFTEQEKINISKARASK